MPVLALLDFWEAFDTVNFNLLIESYLTDRSQCVFASGALSSFFLSFKGRFLFHALTRRD
jgi:hypothetical protein